METIADKKPVIVLVQFENTVCEFDTTLAKIFEQRFPKESPLPSLSSLLQSDHPSDTLYKEDKQNPAQEEDVIIDIHKKKGSKKKKKRGTRNQDDDTYNKEEEEEEEKITSSSQLQEPVSRKILHKINNIINETDFFINLPEVEG